MPAIPIITTAASIGASLYGASKQASAAQSAASDQQAAQEAAIAEQRRQYDLSRGDEMPYMQAGQGALAQMGRLNAGDFSSFKASPDYQFNLSQGLQAIDRGAAARGNLFSGGTGADEQQFGAGLASKQYDDYYGKIANIANLGQDATARTGALGAGAANQIGNSLGNIGDAQAAGVANSANAWSNGITGATSALSNLSQSGFGQSSKPFTGAGGYSMGGLYGANPNFFGGP